jgi:GTP-binding protein HflX
VQQVLQGLGIDLNAETTEAGRPWLEVLNKIDVLDPEQRELVLAQAKRDPLTLPISAVSGEGCDQLLARVEEALATNRLIRRYRLPHDQGAAMSWLYQNGEVLERDDQDEWTELTVRLEPMDVERFTRLHHLLPMDEAAEIAATASSSTEPSPDQSGEIA